VFLQKIADKLAKYYFHYDTLERGFNIKSGISKSWLFTKKHHKPKIETWLKVCLGPNKTSLWLVWQHHMQLQEMIGKKKSYCYALMVNVNVFLNEQNIDQEAQCMFVGCWRYLCPLSGTTENTYEHHTLGSSWKFVSSISNTEVTHHKQTQNILG